MPLSSVQTNFLRKVLLSRSEERMQKAIAKLHPSDLSLLFSELTETETKILLNALYQSQKAGLTLRELPEFMLPEVLAVIDDDKLATILARSEPDNAIFLLEKIPEERHGTLFGLMPEDRRSKLEQLRLYPAGTAGSVMTPDYVASSEDATVAEALQKIQGKHDKHSFYYLYVIDPYERLVGVVSLRSLVTSPPETKISSIMLAGDLVSVSCLEDQERVAHLVGRYNLLAIPVVDDNHRLLGIITFDDVIDIVKDEATEDMYRMAGLSENDRVFTPIHKIFVRRLPWTFVNLLTAFAAASVIAFFQHSIAQFVALAIFLPIVAGMGGNAGIQTLTVITRAIALGELEFASASKVIFKEAVTTLAIGLLMGIVAGFVAYLWQGNPYLGLVLLLAMVSNFLVAGVFGAAVPLTLKALGKDPALGSGIFTTMCTDLFGFLSFLGIATLLIKYLI